MLNFFFPKPRFQIIGWMGMILIVAAYFLVSFEILTVQNIWFQLMNIIGSFGIVLVAYSRRDWQPMVLNIIWMIIALVSISRMLF